MLIARLPDTPPPMSAICSVSTVRPPQRGGASVWARGQTYMYAKLDPARNGIYRMAYRMRSTIFDPFPRASRPPLPRPSARTNPRLPAHSSPTCRSAEKRKAGGEVCLSSLFVYYEVPMFGWVADRKIASRALSHPAIDILALSVVLYDNICMYKLPIQYHTADLASPGTRWRARLASSMICP